MIIHLRHVADTDLPVFFAHQRDPIAGHMVAFTARDPEDRDAFAAHWVKIRADSSSLLRTVLADGAVAGYVTSFVRNGKREVAYWIGREFWGHGVTTAALEQLLALDPTRPLFAGVAADNVGSLRVLEKCGFRAYGRDTGFAKARGEVIDEILLTLTANPPPL